MPSSVDPEERRLVEALTASADPKVASEALAGLMVRYKRLAYAVALESLHDRSLADDVFQETFVRMTRWVRARPGIEVRSFQRLLCAFVRRTALELGRRREGGSAASEEAWALPGLVDAIYVRELLESLPKQAQAVLERTLLRGFSSREVAAEMGLTPENVRLIKHRALRAIREQQSRDLGSLE